MWSWLWLVCSADVLIVYAIIAYQSRCQKKDSAVKMRRLRANQRWDLQTSRQFLERFQLERLTTRSSDRSQRLTTSVRPPLLLINAATSGTIDDTGLPPYYRLCFMVQKELCETLRILYALRRIPVSTALSYLLAFSGIGHVFAEVGRRHWIIVMRKFILFSSACLGIWLNETHKAYDIDDMVKRFTVRDPEEATLEFLMLTIASRVILLQALGPTATLISIVVISTCDAPLFVFSPELLGKIPPLLFLDSRKVAIDRERAELRGREVGGRVGLGLEEKDGDGGVRVEEWVITVRSLSILLTESRLVVFLFNLVSLSLTVLVLQGYTISTTILALLLIAMLPYYVGSTLIPILYIGKRLNLTDEDFRIVCMSWCSRPYACCRAAAMCMWESEVGRMVVRLCGSTPRSPRVSPVIHEGADESEEGGGEEGEKEGDSEDDISMDSEDIAALIDGDSMEGDNDKDDNMEDDNAIDIVVED